MCDFQESSIEIWLCSKWTYEEVLILAWVTKRSISFAGCSHYLSEDVIALTGTLEKDTVLQVGFVLFSSNTKNGENLVVSLRSIAV